MSFVEEYLEWLRNETDLTQISETVTRIGLPFLDRNNDHVDIYIVKRPNGEYLLTDDGATYNELVMSGFEFTHKRAEMLVFIALSHGVMLDADNSIYTVADRASLPAKKHMLALCMMKVSDMFTARQIYPKSLFVEDVGRFLAENRVRNLPNVTRHGKSRMPCLFDFAIPESPDAPERLIKCYNKLDTSKAKILLFGWQDTRSVRSKDSQLYTFINDDGGNVQPSTLLGLTEYEIIPVMWTEREKVIDRLTA